MRGTLSVEEIRSPPSSWQRRRVELPPLLPLGEEPLVERVERRHLLRRELEAEDVHILRHPLGSDRLWERHVPVLHGPAHQNLRSRDAVPRGRRLQRGVVEAERARERGVGDQADATRRAEGLDLVLSQKGVQLNLVGGWHHARARRIDQLLQVGDAKVAHPDAPRESEPLRLLECEPVLDPLLRVDRPVNQVEVGARAQRGNARVDCVEHGREPVLDPAALRLGPHL
mmetsp:Transcript_27930/g.91091  ORF Transcript_27930/g.91091 Transcript_27930/m.91091 type:complete len:228 (+) Transcript_27930:100-783(+)